MSDEIKVEVVEQLLVVEPRNAGWNLELNIVKWNDKEPTYDLRPWNADHSRCGKGITLSEENLKAIVKYCGEARITEI